MQHGARDPAQPAFALPDKPSIAVLPFQNISGDPEQEYFADGMVEEIITALSRIRWLFVIARRALEQQHGITLRSKDQPLHQTITGHIDFLQVRNGAVHILDY